MQAMDLVTNASVAGKALDTDGKEAGPAGTASQVTGMEMVGRESPGKFQNILKPGHV